MFPLSRFMSEIPSSMVEKYSGRQNQHGFASSGSRATVNSPASPSTIVQSPLRTPIPRIVSPKESYGGAWKAADKAQHAKWGVGTVIEVKGSGDSLELKIAFPGQGIKVLMANMAPITKV